MKKVSTTEVQNNFGKYLNLCQREPIVITKNGKRIAMLMNVIPDDAEFANEAFPVYGTSPRKNPNWVTYSQFVKMDEENEGRFELIDGEVFELAAPSFSHQKALGELYSILKDYLAANDGCDVFLSPLDIFLVRKPNLNEDDILEFYTSVVQPDLQVLCNYEDDIDEKDRYKGIPKLVVEILSPSTRTKDLWNKLHLYSDCGISEYWVVDPKTRTISVYTYPEADSRPTATFRNDEIAESGCFKDLKVPLDRVF